jgi:hypothetical protein
MPNMTMIGEYATINYINENDTLSLNAKCNFCNELFSIKMNNNESFTDKEKAAMVMFQATVNLHTEACKAKKEN